MQRQKKKRTGLRIVGAILLLAAAAFGVLWFLDYQERPKLVDGVKYQVPHRSDHAEVVGCDPEAASLVIRSEYRGKPVTRIAAASFKGSKAETIEIPSTIKALGVRAFAGSGIRAIEIPAWVNEIDDHAFQDCAALETVTVLGNPYKSSLYIMPFGQYGPGTSKLYLRRFDGSDTCYRLYRVGVELELEAKLFDPDESRTVSFPSGPYILRIARGSEWISDEEAFGPNGRYSVIYYEAYKPGETYEITTTSDRGNVMRDSAGNF